MSKTKNPAEKELDAIRIKLYEQTKGMSMSASEVTEYIKKQIAPTVEKHHIPVSSAPFMRRQA